ncbi:unnamed protein product [Mytilus coruscus]|uniref:Protein SPEC3 n=1 Tax=Mytilus coruscus TaxID=42192 RepID=A0A6J8CEP8_MYTCO|nr:unnamed protein product [Mytilus coruscus]
MSGASEKRTSAAARRNTEGKLKLVRSKSKLPSDDSKGREFEKGTFVGRKKEPLKDDKNQHKDQEQIKITNMTGDDKSFNDSSTTVNINSVLKYEKSEPNQNGGVPKVSDVSSKTNHVKDEQNEIKRATKKDSEKRILIPKEITKLSIDNQSEASVNGAIQSTSVSVPIEKPRYIIAHNDSWIMSVIPYLPLGLAVVYLILNIVIPGSGTILSGFSILCCGKCRVQTKDDQRLVTLCVNVCVGVSQLFTVTFLLVGWFWSIAWGVNMVLLAVELSRQKKQQRERELQANVLNAFGNSMPVKSLFPGMK